MTARRNPPGAYRRIQGQWRWVDDERPWTPPQRWPLRARFACWLVDLVAPWFALAPEMDPPKNGFFADDQDPVGRALQVAYDRGWRDGYDQAERDIRNRSYFPHLRIES